MGDQSEAAQNQDKNNNKLLMDPHFDHEVSFPKQTSIISVFAAKINNKKNMIFFEFCVHFFKHYIKIYITTDTPIP